MIVLEFRLAETFQYAASTLERIKIPFQAERSPVEFRPHRLWLFQDALRSRRQWDALARARSLEREDRLRCQDRALPNLAEPS